MRTHTLKGEKIIHSKEYWGNKPRRMDFERSNQYLQDLKEVLDSLEVRFFLIYGTLLGAIREEDFIEGDDDVDVGIFKKDMTREKVKEYEILLKEKGYKLYWSMMTGDICNRFYIAKPGMKDKVDAYTFYQMGDSYYTLLYSEPNNWYLTYPAKYFADMKKIQFKGADYHVPTPPEEFLEYLWGDWWIASGGQWGKNEMEILPEKRENFVKSTS